MDQVVAGDHVGQVVASVVDAALRQGEFLASLATAVLGGCIALIVWVAVKPRDPEPTHPRAMWLVTVAALLTGLSLAFFYVGYGRIILSIPTLAAIQTAEPMQISELHRALNDAGLSLVSTWFLLQAAVFALGIGTLLAFGLRNSSLLTTSDPRKSN